MLVPIYQNPDNSYIDALEKKIRLLKYKHDEFLGIADEIEDRGIPKGKYGGYDRNSSLGKRYYQAKIKAEKLEEDIYDLNEKLEKAKKEEDFREYDDLLNYNPNPNNQDYIDLMSKAGTLMRNTRGRVSREKTEELINIMQDLMNKAENDRSLPSGYKKRLSAMFDSITEQAWDNPKMPVNNEILLIGIISILGIKIISNIIGKK